MKAIYLLIPLSLLLLSLAVWAFFWAVRNDQFDDLDTPAMDILDDEEKRVTPSQQAASDSHSDSKDSHSNPNDGGSER